jgi:hypothetical protein
LIGLFRRVLNPREAHRAIILLVATVISEDVGGPGHGRQFDDGEPVAYDEDLEDSERRALKASVALPLRSYLGSLTPGCRRQLLDMMEEAAIRGSHLFAGKSESTVATLLGEMDRGGRVLEVPDLWRAVSFLADHALTDVWDNLTRWDIPRTAVAAYYTYTRIRLPEWEGLHQTYREATDGKERFEAMCAAMVGAGRFVAANADDRALVVALRHRTQLPADQITRMTLLFGRLAAVGPGFLSSIGETLSIPPEELADLPLATPEKRRKWGLDAAGVRRVAVRYAKLPLQVAQQNQLLASQLALLTPNPSDVLNLIPPPIRQGAGLGQSSFAGLCEFNVGRMERHARECRLFAQMWAERDLNEDDYLRVAQIIVELAEQYHNEGLALGRLIRLSLYPDWNKRVNKARSEMLDVLVHTVLPICWNGLRAMSIYTLLPIDKPRNLPIKRQQENEKQLFRVIAAISPVIEESGNRQALDALRGAMGSFINAVTASIKPSWFLAFRTDRGEALAMTAHFLCILGALGRGGEITSISSRLSQQKIKVADLMPCNTTCGKACKRVVLGG